MTRIPHVVAGAWPELKAARFASSVRRDSAAGCTIALLGLPDDTGVRLNGGRPGAAQGPRAFRSALAAFGTPWDGVLRQPLDTHVYDAGDVEPVPGGDADALFATHDRVREAVAALHALGLIPFCVGGGHDLSLPSIAALAASAGAPVGGVNLDAHLDVRERVGSGMPFRRLIEGGLLDPAHFVELGLGRFSNEAADDAWLRGRGARLVPVEQVLAFGVSSLDEHLAFATSGNGVAFVSVDLDGLDASVAPGVSAMNPMGLRVEHATALVEAAGRHPGVRHIDVMELCPPEDVSGRTARIAALLFLTFLAGFGQRTT